MNLHFLGGAMEIGGSAIYVRIADKGILMDCGIRQSAGKDPIPDFRTIQEQGGLDAILVSHAHMDHIGTLPIISRAYPGVPIYMTAMTADLTRVLLYDSLKIMKNREDEIPHYSEQDVLSMLGRIQTLGYQTPFPILEGFTLTFYPAGHIAGAACIYLVTKEGTLFYSGDFSAFSQRTIEGIRIPKLRPDIAIVETTYGTRLHANRQVEEKRLAELVRECLLQKKKILIPAFALGRAQEVILILRAAIQNQEIPAVPVYVDGMVRDINSMYTRNPTYLKNALGKRILKGNEPFYTKEIQPVAPNHKREELMSGSDPVIFLSSSGMLTGGPSTQYAARLAASEDACIIITGYQDEESPGRQLLNAIEHPEDAVLTLNGTAVPVKCRICQVGLSAHGDKSEIMSLLERISARHVFLVHGNREVIQELGNELASEDYRRRIYLPECGQEYEITLNNKRKQLSFRPEFTMQMAAPFRREDEKRLWDYWQAHYPGQAFPVSGIAHIWYGKERGYLPGVASDEALLQEMQSLLLDSRYFSSNERRLFLFEANPPEKVEQALAPRELTQQELALEIERFFTGFPYRKISYHNGRKEILLQFDYPDSQDRDLFLEKADAFAAATGWNAGISPSMNHNAAALFLSVLLGDKIEKLSYFADRKCYTVTLCEAEEGEGTAHTGNAASDREVIGRTAVLDGKTTERTAASYAEAAEHFLAVTGWSLVINGEPGSSDSVSGAAASAVPKGTHDDFFCPENARAEIAEQNLAFFCIDQTFEALPHRPEKKSLRQDAHGKYLEIAFISPMIGNRYAAELQALSNQTGWRICIADRVNQNGLLKNAQLLCMKYGISLAKSPSYLPERRAVQMKLREEAPAEILEEVSGAFEELTGCGCTFIG